MNELLLDISSQVRWQFPVDPNQVLDFLLLYAGTTLKELYLHINSRQIMSILRQKCPNIHTLCYFGNEVFPRQGRGKCTYPVYFPPGLKSFTFQRTWFNKLENSTDACSRDEELLSQLSQCRELKEITLYKFYLNRTSLEKLTKSTKLAEITLVSCETSVFNLVDFDDILVTTVGHLRQLRGLRLQNCICPQPVELHALFQKISHWTHLQVLELRYFKYDDESFKLMVPGLLNLRILELEGNSVTSTVVSLIGKYLKRIELLELENGSYLSKSLLSLTHHPTLKTLSIICKREKERLLHCIYDVLVTLPKLQSVMLRGYMFSKDYFYTEFPKIESAEIEIQSMDRPVGWEGANYLQIRKLYEAQF